MPENQNITLSAQKPQFRLEVVNVLRDFFQGLYANRIPLDHPAALEILKLWNSLVGANNENLKYGAFEIGGAHPQVTVEFHNRDFMEVYRRIREAAPATPLRPLWRGANGFLLSPSHSNDLKHLLTHLAEDVATPEDASPKELLRIKIFDSQGKIEEVGPSVQIIAQLYKKNHPISAEIAIPYSKGDTYPDLLYVTKIVEAAALLKRHGLPLEQCRISLKDMVGELDAVTVERLLPLIINALKEQNLFIQLGLHLHDTGHATASYVAGIKAARAAEYPFTIDIVECALFKPEYTEENSWKNTGFASLLAIEQKLAEAGIELGITPDERKKLEKMGQLALSLAGSHSIKRADPALSAKELREFHIPGGGFASFSTAVAKMELAQKLGISEQDALKIAGHALNAVGRLMGEPFAVTPGFQNKQIAALNLLQNMIDKKMIGSGILSFDAIKKIVLEKLTNEQVKSLFLHKLDPVVKEFLKGEMPAETLADLKETLRKKSDLTSLASLDSISAQVHPVIRAELPRRTGLLSLGVNSKLEPAQKIIGALLEEGKLKISPTQMKSLLRKIKIQVGNVALFANMNEDELYKLFVKNNFIYHPGTQLSSAWLKPVYLETVDYFKSKGDFEETAQEKASIIIEAVLIKIRQTHVTWALELGDPNKLRAAIERPWSHEPDPENPGSYHFSVQQVQRGLDPEPDAIVKIYELVKKNKLPLSLLRERLEYAAEQEKIAIEMSVCEFISEHKADISILLHDKENSSAMLEKLIEKLYKKQKAIIQQQESSGKGFILKDARRLDFAFKYFNELLIKLSQNTQEDFSKKINIKRQDIENSTITTPVSGHILRIYIDTSGGPIAVKQGDPIAMISANKMQYTIYAATDGLIRIANIKEKDSVSSGQTLAIYEQKSSISTISDSKVSNVPLIEFDPIDAEYQRLELALSKITGKLDDQKPRIVSALQAPANRSTIETEQSQYLQRCGYNAPTPLYAREVVAQTTTPDRQDEVHIINNRAGCASKIYADLTAAGCENIHVLYTKADETTPIIANAKAGVAIQVDSYTDHSIILQALMEQAKKYPGKKIFLHPGWGFLSENDAFVKELEILAAQGYQIKFVGPPSKPMRLAGGKLTLRDIVAEVAPHFNPIYFGNPDYSAVKLQQYIDSDFKLEPYNELYRTIFRTVEKMGGDVMIKAIAGGGGRGIRRFVIDKKKSYEENYRDYIRLVQENAAYSEKHFGNGQMLTEQCIQGKTRHLEVQFGCTRAGAQVLGLRDCTLQNNNQKIYETNVLTEDYPEGTIHSIINAARKVAAKLSEEGYTGVGTLEMLISPNGVPTILEVNTRIQVEHMVTEDDIFLKTQKNISLAWINFLFTRYPDQKPEDILAEAYGLNPADFMKIIFPGSKRVAHLRINSREINYATGLSLPSFFADGMWASALLDNISKKFNVRIIQGGLGQGKYDPQVGTISGEEADVLLAARAIAELAEIAQQSYRSDGKLSIDFVLELQAVIYNVFGNFSPDISTKTVDEFLKAIEAQKIVLALDPEHIGNSLKLKKGAMKAAFAEFLHLQAAQTPQHSAKL